MSKAFLPFFLSFVLLNVTKSQQSNSGFGTPMVTWSKVQCLTDEQRSQVQKIIKSNKQAPSSRSVEADEVLFQWPVRQSDNYSEREAIGISNYVDLADAFPDNLLDYNCGQRTYDTGSGYNHQGTDIYSWPFGWKKMDTDQIEIIAAASGTIIFKRFTENDKSCALNNNQWNAVYIQHDDGSIAWYGHLKKNSLTSKEVGESVEAGDYLGVMGSSGNSTGPHLHFEVYDSNSNLVDPFMGSCNQTTDRSWWAEQPDYVVSGVSNLYTHHSPPTFGCYGEEVPNIKLNYIGNEVVYFATYFRDQLNGRTSTHSVYKPDGSLFQSWTTTPAQFYSGSFWWRSFTMPATGDLGKWTFEVEYQGEIYSEYFYLNSSESDGTIDIALDTLFFPVTPVGTRSQQTFSLDNAGTNGTYIESITFPQTYSGNWDGRIYDGESKNITVHFEPTHTDIFAGKLVLKTGASGTKEVVLYGKTEAEITRVIGVGNSLDFGSVNTREFVSITSSISNTGNAPLVINPITYPEGFSGIRNLTIDPNETYDLSITFRPTEAKDYSGLLRIESNATGGQSEIQLNGIGNAVLSVKDADNIEIYPNPNTTGLLKLSHFSEKVEIFDSSGKLVKTAEDQAEIDISSFNAGLYFVVLKRNPAIAPIKLIVQ